MNSINKTVVTCVSIITIGAVIIALSFLYYLYAVNHGMEKHKVVPMDKFTTCIKTAMDESRQSNKPISAKEASDICVNMFMKDK